MLILSGLRLAILITLLGLVASIKLTYWDNGSKDEEESLLQQSDGTANGYGSTSAVDQEASSETAESENGETWEGEYDDKKTANKIDGNWKTCFRAFLVCQAFQSLDFPY